MKQSCSVMDLRVYVKKYVVDIDFGWIMKCVCEEKKPALILPLLN